MNHDNEEGESEIFLHQGYQSLDTNQSLAYLRYVDETDGEIGRIQREQRFLKHLLINLQKIQHFWLFLCCFPYKIPLIGAVYFRLY